MIQMIRPSNRAEWLRARGFDVTASQVGALFGAHEYTTLYGLWAAKTGRVSRDDEETPAIQRGRLLEPVAVQLLREQYPKWRIDHNAAENIYFRDPDARLGGTPDVLVTAKDRGKGVVQIKSVEASVFRKKWIDEDGNVEPPLWIALQASLEAYLTGSVWAAVAPLVIGYGVDMPLVEVPLVDGVVDAMKAKAAEFWQMVAEGREPPPDFARDGALIERIYGYGDPEHEIDLSADNRIPELIEERQEHANSVRGISARIDEIDTEIKAKLGAAHVAHLGEGRRITWKPQKRDGFFVEPTTIRPLRYPKARN
ncbi:YqaJ viral recombinase family protein [Devosia ginsengisoli]|uniref:YqaJ viral recombinase family nuclease n=1 Tax=Devosia ginsengisoli TaxID=400770 RepID=UPI0026EF8967|nr:YqaJ viral recombinase family protein [Devosia ginsengisoli]MCR6673286.1 YqaJ viral recombinase family protein [Devosia ginsengisoli]